MADEYGICRKTFNKLLIKKKIILDKGLICPREQENIYKELGFPDGTMTEKQLSRSQNPER